MSGLYLSGYCPAGVAASWERTSVTVTGEGQAGEILRRFDVTRTWGDPIEAVGFFAADGKLRALVADFENGQRVELRIIMQGAGRWHWQSKFRRWKDAA